MVAGMGKASRLKRLHRLERADQRALVDRVRGAMPDDRIELVHAPAGVEKMSKVILEFAEPVLDAAHTNEQRAAAIQLAVMAWNLGCMASDARPMDLELETLKSMSPEVIDALASLVDRKLALFADINRPILDYQLRDTDEGLFLNVVAPVENPDGFIGQAGA